ncbi:MAG: tryptophan tryptophylquinone biosynthesis enzyme MauG [Methylotenera sp. 24-45-7]|nr:MAG: tryptophan tryptophylquinone biosynthesis enzyme MauG [Mehylophilales bacterium 35-46-6]OYZ41847.1 MAG: tryptophan tryptophylquinone biosynthesis enzyme MauG [Methylotenera sp. 24-45-7]OZA09752.1 MAG: tryptophan tryptophylquinone biosynthesis enzyme MauG [Methylotenera sp. 17-45-7]OZA54258.1 MAG: tryptophan tryptophylquinone biosynthesis enzyme MauG [Methylophilales bacterium 39-45-7]
MEMRTGPVLRLMGLLLTLLMLTAAGGSLATDAASKDAYRRPDGILSPSYNPLTTEKATLGKTLFFDARLSRDGKMSCGSCHAPDKRWSDGRLRPIGSESVANARRTPTVLNSAWLTALMWDGRASSLEAQAVLPITTPHEMNFDMPGVVARLQNIQGYRTLFAKAFGDADVNQQRITQALASFQRTLVSNISPFDRWVAGDENAISASAKRGFALFENKAKCVACHKSWRFTDDSFHDIGLRSEDIGRGAKVPPQVTLMQYAFKTPSLRDLPINGPYMHDGSMLSLEEVIKHYEQGGIDRKSRSLEMKAFELTDEERLTLVEFIKTLDGGMLKVDYPSMPE